METGSRQAVWLIGQEYLYGCDKFLAVRVSHFSATQPCHRSLLFPRMNLLANQA
jgi:hypothetical protein